MTTGAQESARVLPSDAGCAPADVLAAYLDAVEAFQPFTRRPDGVARRDFLLDEERDRAASTAAEDAAAVLAAEPSLQARAVAAQRVMDAIDSRVERERVARDAALWVLLGEHDEQVRRTGAYLGTGWTPRDACRLVCVSRSQWENRIRPRHRARVDWTEAVAEERGASAGRLVRDLALLRAAVRPVRDQAVRILTGDLKNVVVADMLGITPERVAQIRTGSG